MPQVWLWGLKEWQLSVIYHRPSPRQIYSKAAITQPSASHLSLLFPCSSCRQRGALGCLLNCLPASAPDS